MPRLISSAIALAIFSAVAAGGYSCNKYTARAAAAQVKECQRACREVLGLRRLRGGYGCGGGGPGGPGGYVECVCIDPDSGQLVTFDGNYQGVTYSVESSRGRQH